MVNIMKTIKNMFKSIVLLSLISTAYADRYDSEYTYAPVVDVQPIYSTYQIPEEHRVCENRPNRTRHYNSNRRHSNAGGAILGGIIGGLVGNHFGDGRGRDAATAAGIIAGAAIGSNARPVGYYDNRRHGRRYNRHQRRCYTETEYRQEQRISGYDVSYDYDGKIHHTRLQNHPGDRVRIRVNVQVAEY